MRGLVKIEVVRHLKGKEERSSQFGHNLISNGGLSLMGAGAVNDLLSGTSRTAGKRLVRHSLFNRGGYSTYTTYPQIVADSDSALSCALLGLSAAEWSSLTSLKSFLPVLGSNGKVDANKIRALANLLNNATSTNGTSEAENALSLKDRYRIGNKFNFPIGTGTGSVTGVAMVPGGWKPGEVPSGGTITFTRIDDCDALIDRTVGGAQVVPPGMNGLGLAVGMKFTTDDGVVSHVRNLVTGEQVDGASTDWFPASDMRAVYDDGTYIYYVKRLVTVGNYAAHTIRFAGYQNQYAYRIRKDNAYVDTLTYLTSSYAMYGYLDGVFNYNGSLYFVRSGNSNGTLTGVPTMMFGYGTWGLNGAGSQTVVSGWTNIAAAFSSIFGITLPSGWEDDLSIDSIIPCNVGNYKGLVVGRHKNVANSSAVRGSAWKEVWVFSDGSDVVGSLVDIIPCLDFDDIVWSFDGNYGVLAIGNYIGAYGGYMTDQNGIEPGYVAAANMHTEMFKSDGRQIVDSSGTESYASSPYYGVYLALPGQWSSWISAKELESAVPKTSDTEMKVEYDYAFESTGMTPGSDPSSSDTSTARDYVVSSGNGGGGGIY